MAGVHSRVSPARWVGRSCSLHSPETAWSLPALQKVHAGANGHREIATKLGPAHHRPCLERGMEHGSAGTMQCFQGCVHPHHHWERPEDTGCVLGGGGSRSLWDDPDQWVQGISGVPGTVLQQRLQLHTPSFTFWEIVEEDQEMCLQHPDAAVRVLPSCVLGEGGSSRAQAEMTELRGR